jgi:hypothetical protein
MKDLPESIPEEIVSAWRTIEGWVWDQFGGGRGSLTRLTRIGPEVLLELLDHQGNVTKITTLFVTRKLSRSSSSSIEGSWSLPRVEDLGFVTPEEREQVVEEMDEAEKQQIRELKMKLTVYQEFVAAYRAMDELLDDGLDRFSRAHVLAVSQRVERADRAVEAIEKMKFGEETEGQGIKTDG